jgi:5,10-methylene-tetrahydrofolate dehydrogenase/methenyl tetrahydrofolate cyclohydrolase
MSTLLSRAKKVADKINLSNKQFIYKEIMAEKDAENVIAKLNDDAEYHDIILTIMKCYEWT